jgi:glycerol-3-phosphate acyltransferase PlsY
MFDFLSAIDWVDAWPYYLGVTVFGYLLGSIPFGVIFTRLSGGGDVRDVGSGGIGATNVLRTGKRWAAAATLICDAGKGAVAVLLVRWYFHHNNDLAAFAALGAFLGHLFPVWIGFRGGKGIATGLGILLALFWPAGVIGGAVWLLSVAIFRISSLSSLIASVAVPVVLIFFHQPLYVLLSIVLAVLTFIMHRENIARLIAGTEPRIGASKSPSP